MAQSRHGLHDIDDEHLVGAAYRASIEVIRCRFDSVYTITLAVFVVDTAVLKPFDLCSRWRRISYLGGGVRCLTDTADANRLGRKGKLEHLGLYNIGFRGPNDSFIIRANSASAL